MEQGIRIYDVLQSSLVRAGGYLWIIARGPQGIAEYVSLSIFMGHGNNEGDD